MTSAYPLEPSAREMRSMGRAALDFVVGFIEGLPAAPAMDLEDTDALVRSLRAPAPEIGTGFGPLLATVSEGAAKAVEYAGPGFLGYIPGGGLFASALADFIACVVNRYVSLAEIAPAFAQIEATVIRWFCDLFELRPEARGILTSGGSMANFSALVTARRTMLPEDFLCGTLYVSDQAHHSVLKAAMLTGFPPGNVRVVRTDDDLRLDVRALEEAIERDRADGMRPFCVVATAGTTNTGAVDPLREIASVASERNLWLHVDAAYGGFFQLTERGRRVLDGITLADSITLDPHKGLFLPYGTGCLLVRDGSRLRDAHRVTAAYLDRAVEGDTPNFADYSPELSRDFRGLRVWLPVRLHGLRSFRSALDEKLDLAAYLHDSLRDAPGFELPWPSDLTVVAFRFRPEDADADALNARLLERINASGRIFLSSTVVRERLVLRACVLSHRTHRERVEEAVWVMRSAAAELTERA